MSFDLSVDTGLDLGRVLLPEINSMSSVVMDLHRALAFDDVWSSIQRLIESAIPHDTLIMSMNYLDWRREASIKRLTSEHSRVLANEEENQKIAQLGRSFFQPFLEASIGVPCYKHTQIMTNKERMNASDYYQQYMHPNRWGYSAHLLLWNEANVHTSIAIRRNSNEGDFSDQEMDMLNKIHPHIGIALDRVHRYEAERQRRNLLEMHYHSNPEAVLFVDWDGKTMFASEEAQAACCTWNFGNEARRYNHKKVFEIPSLIQQGCDDLRDKWLQQKTNEDGRRASLMQSVAHTEGDQVALITLKHNGSGDLERPVFVIKFTRKPNSGESQTPDKSKLLLMLTPMERELVGLVCKGHSNREIADILCKAEGSIKVQLSNVYQKLQVKSRTQLVLSFR